MHRPTRTRRLSIAAILELLIACALLASCHKSHKPDRTTQKRTEESSLRQADRTSASVMKQQFLAKMAKLDPGGINDFHLDEFHRIAGEAYDSSAIFEAAMVYFEFTPAAIGATPRGRTEILIYRNGHLWKDTDLEEELDLKKSKFDAGKLNLYSKEGRLVKIAFRPKLAVQPSDDFVDHLDPF